MNRKITAVVLVIALIAAGIVVAAEKSGAFSIRDLLGLGPEQGEEGQAAETAGSDWAKPSGDQAGAESLQLDDIQQVMNHLDGRQRQALLADQQTFQRFVQQEADNLSVLAAAKANKVHEDPNTRYLMQRGAENILRETYVNRLIAGKVPAGFPSEEQIKEYYDKNKEKFVLGERVHVWQIFIPLEQNADQKTADPVRKQAEALLKDINDGKVDFGAAAAKYSQHEPSRFNAGYMGLVRVSELKEEIRKPLMALAENKVSGVIRTESGLHILKRGAVVPAQPVTYDEVKDEIRQLLQRQAQAQLRQAIFDQARKSYPVDIKEAKVEEWRLRLRTNMQAAAQQKEQPKAGAKSQ